MEFHTMQLANTNGTFTNVQVILYKYGTTVSVLNSAGVRGRPNFAFFIMRYWDRLFGENISQSILNDTKMHSKKLTEE